MSQQGRELTNRKPPRTLRQATRLAWRKCKRFLEFLLATAFDRLILAGLPIRSVADCAVLHVELLGDYVLWRPYGRALVQHLRQQGRQVYLIVEDSAATLAACDFHGCHLVSVSRQRVMGDLGYRARTLRRLRRLHVEQTYLASCPREGLTHDAIVGALGAPALGFEAVFSDRPWPDRAWNRRRYASGLVADTGWTHKNLPHCRMLEALGVDSSSVCPLPPQIADKPDTDTRENYWILAPGASHTGRRWPVSRFAAVANWLGHLHPDWICVLVGSAAERGLAKTLEAQLSCKVENRVGATSVRELQTWIAGAKLVLGNDSAAGHFAAALGVPAVVAVGGGHHGRCYPYAPDASPVLLLPTVVTTVMECFHCDWNCRYPVAAGAPFRCLEQIDVASVCDAVSRAIDQHPERR